MSKEQSNSLESSHSTSNIPTDLLSNTLPARSGPYRSLSAKRPRDPSHRKSVSFNDVPIVHEVPSHDSMRNANCTTFRSWTYTDTTPTSPTIPSFYSSQLIPPFNSTSAAAQKIHANRLSSSLYSSLSTNTTASRIPDWALRAKTAKAANSTEETATSNLNGTSTNTGITAPTSTTTTNESNTNTWTPPPVIIVHTPDEKTSTKDVSPKSTFHSTYNNPYITSTPTVLPPAPPPAPHSSLALNTSDSHEEKKHPYRAAVMAETEHHRSLPFTYEPVSDSTATYTSMLSTNILAANTHTSNSEQTATSHYPRTARARSATLPLSVTHQTTRGTDSISITPFRPPTSLTIQNGNPMPSRTVLRPTTIAFQCAQSNSTTIYPSGTANVTTTLNNGALNSALSSNNTTTPKPPAAPPRFASSAAAVAAAHSRYGLSSTRTLPNSSLVTSTIKYAFAHPTLETTFNPTITTTTTGANGTMSGTSANSTGTTPPRPPPTAYPRSRSANVLGTRRHASALESHHAHSSTTNPTNSLYSTSKRNPNVRQNYGSYYMHRVLLPTTTN